ncbi:MAG TPA: phosphoadenosine phosphosulfate reductase [Proteobacteria bacterium]|nr:phosphoadenosine phosphosulfate reductase [Pseudomonadota bacterium]
MYDVVWDAETNGIILCDNSPEGVKTEIRPVFFEELDLLGFDKHWVYPRARKPLLWATSVGRRYFYRGEPVAEAKGGAFFKRPEIVFFKKDLSLEPVDVSRMLDKNAKLLEGLVQKSILFIRRTQDKYSTRADIAAVAFSGGKDSLVLLDLCQRALNPDEFVVVFGDTTMEISPTLDAVEQAKKRWTHLRFHTARSEKEAIVTWQEFGSPSRIHRWCCSVHKSVPTWLLLRDLTGKPSIKALIFDGIRWDESQTRKNYQEICPACKHTNQTNASPLLRWSAAEVFLYLFQRRLLYNKAYRYGFVRVGCSVCPLSSNWWDSLLWLSFPSECSGFIQILLDYAANGGKTNEDRKREYISSGAWQGRAGGRFLSAGENRVEVAPHGDALVFSIDSARTDWLEWVKALGLVERTGPDSGRIHGRGFIWTYSAQNGDRLSVRVAGLGNADRYQIGRLRAVINKAAYCVGCRACEVECPTGALSVNGQGVAIDQERCSHCFRCLSFDEKGCLAAKSLWVTKGEKSVRGINRYQHFGMRRKWLEEFFAAPHEWWENNSLGNRQFEAMKVWLKECGIIQNKRLTPLGERLKALGVESLLTWQVIWANLAMRSELVGWYLENVAWGEGCTKRELVDLIPDTLSKATRENAIKALVGILRDTPLGEMGLGLVVRRDSRTVAVEKKGLEKVDQLAVLYSLYAYAEGNERYGLTLEELYHEPRLGPYRLYGLQRDVLRQILRGLSSSLPQLISVEMVMDLDNIHLRQNRSSQDVLNGV